MPYMNVFAGGLMGVHLMCRRCGALIAPKPHKEENAPEGTVSPEMAHDAFHARIDRLAELLGEENA